MPRLVELHDLSEFDDWLADPRRSLKWVALQGVDLRDRAEVLAATSVKGTLFLGCLLTPASADDLHDRGALIFPALPDLPFQPYRGSLYSAAELYAGLDEGYEHTPDAQIYAWQRRPHTQHLTHTVGMSLHDHAMLDALDELPPSLRPEHTLGVMGGHAAARGSDDYRAAAELAAKLTSAGLIVLTGGGPGAMEAANLGAAIARPGVPVDTPRLTAAVDSLAEVPSFRPPEQGGQGIDAWATRALQVVEEFGAHGLSIGVPTWFYGHEPPNPFASHIAKFFSNALREDTLLHRCRRGIIYLPGAAGTVQEIFQAATGNYYAPASVTPAPMVLVGVEHWTNTLPAWPLLEALGRDRAMGQRVHLVDSVAEAAEVLGD